MSERNDLNARRVAFIEACEKIPRLSRWSRKRPEETRELFNRVWDRSLQRDWSAMNARQRDQESEDIERAMVAGAEDERYGVIETIIIGILVKLIIAWLTENVFTGPPDGEAA